MPQQLRRLLLSLVGLLAFVTPASAGKLVITIDDFGYHSYTENQVLTMPPTISVAVLPNAPHACEMTIKAHNNRHEVLIHLLMASLSERSLEEDTLCPEMSSGGIGRIIRDVVSKVPNTAGPDNHMGSAVTPSLFGMQKVIQALECYDLYFLNSVTIGNNQTMHAVSGIGMRVIKCKVFLDDTQNEADTRRQFNRIAEPARRNGSVIAIDRPHPSTVRVLQQMLYSLPADITLVHPGSLFNEPRVGTSRPNLTPPKNGTPDTPRDPFRGMKLCKPERPLEPVCVSRFLSILGESITQGTLVQYTRLQWQG